MRPKLIIIAGPNGSGKTSLTSQILRHDWIENCEYINPDNIAEEKCGHDVPISKIIQRYYKSIINCTILSNIVDRLYIYDNSIDFENPRLLFRTKNGQVEKFYSDTNSWA